MNDRRLNKSFLGIVKRKHFLFPFALAAFPDWNLSLLIFIPSWVSEWPSAPHPPCFSQCPLQIQLRSSKWPLKRTNGQTRLVRTEELFPHFKWSSFAWPSGVLFITSTHNMLQSMSQSLLRLLMPQTPQMSLTSQTSQTPLTRNWAKLQKSPIQLFLLCCWVFWLVCKQ